MNKNVKERFDLNKMCVLAGQGEQTALYARHMIRCQDAGMSLMECKVQPKSLLPPHTHMHTHQAVYVIKGDLTFNLGGDDGLTFPVPEGSYVIKPKRILHSFWNTSDDEVTYIELSDNDLFEGFIDSFSDKDLFSATRDAHVDFGMFTDIEYTVTLMKRHKLTRIEQFGLDFSDTDHIQDILSAAPPEIVSAFRETFGPALENIVL
ncbi:MAG: cupin domain-containing protein [Myxococcota bacterium]